MPLALALAAVITVFVTGHWIAAAAAVLTMPYWLGPVVVRLTSRASAEPVFDRFDPNEDGEPARVAEYFAGVTESLAAEGFTVGADLSQRYSADLAMRVRYFHGDQTGYDAIAFAGFTTGHGDVQQLVTYVELLSELADGTVLLTNNSPRVGVFAPSAERVLHQLPQLGDATRLVHAHRALVRRRESPAVPSRFAADPAGELARSMVREMEHQVDAGLYWLDDAARAYRPTLTGAAIMCWRLLPPLRTIRTAAVHRRAETLLRELGLDRPAPAASASPGPVPTPTDYIKAEPSWLWKIVVAAATVALTVTWVGK